MTVLRVRVQTPGMEDREIEVGKSPSLVGRLPECDVHLPYSSVSRKHARLVRGDDGEWSVEHLGARNGTLLNGRYVETTERLKAGDRIGLGAVYLQIDATADESGASVPAEPSFGNMTMMKSVVDLRRQWISPELPETAVDSGGTRSARLHDLLEIAKDLNLAVSIDAIFDQAKDVVFRYLQSVDRLALLVDADDDGNLRLVNAAARNAAAPAALANDDSWVSRSICRMAFTDRVAVQTADAQLDDRFSGAKSIVLNDIRTAIAVPLWNEEVVVGVLYADARIPSHQWQSKGEDDLSFFSALANLVATSVQRWRLGVKLKSEEDMRRRLERYHSPAVALQLAASGASAEDRLRPKDTEITVLFADIVGFTALSERLSPTEVADLLNEFFEEMLEEIFAHGGTLDKFIGDCVMVFFGAPENQTDHAERAVRAAVGMLRRLDCLNDREAFVQPLQLRIAVNSGRAVVGDVGSSRRLEYTALGSTINLASRMETVCSPGECVISESTYALLADPSGWSDMGPREFRGIQRPVRLYHGRQ